MAKSWNKVESVDKTDTILDGLNRLYEAKLSGASTDGDLKRIILPVSELFQNQIKLGKVNEAEVESFETLIPNGTYATNEDLTDVLKEVKEGNTDALMQREIWNKHAKPVEGFSKGLRKVS